MPSILYISYDGLTDPLGRSQVLPYLIGCAARGHRIHILSCEKPDRFDRDREAIETICQHAGITWHPRRYHKAPPVLSAMYDLAGLRREAARLHRKHGFGLVHCRSYIPAAAGLSLKRQFGVPLLFDMRGFWPEEKTEGGSWNLANPLFRMVYRYFKQLESALLRDADGIISLTEAGKYQLLSRPELSGRSDRITVIPCCVDFEHFPLAHPASRAAVRGELGIPADAPVLCYLGSLGSWYMLPEMLEFFRVFRGRYAGARFLLVSLEDPEVVRDAAIEHGLPADEVIVRPASRDEVPQFLAAADVGISFIQPVFSKIASSPTKMGEMLAVGMPIVANAGVGDVADIIAEIRCGAPVESFDRASYSRALADLDACATSPKERRKRARAAFDVAMGADRYDALYRKLALDPPGQETNGQWR